MTGSLTKPKPLKLGDKVALLAPASPVSEKLLTISVKSLKFLGLEPVIYPSCMLKHGYLSGSDKERALDVNTAFQNKSIKGIFCIRGGYGCMRILPLLDYEMIKANPKVFIGYSDITALHFALNKYCGFMTFHGPMPGIGYHTIDSFSVSSLKDCIFLGKLKKPIQNPHGIKFSLIYPGKGCGILTGGNLSMTVALLGTPFEPDTAGKILFLEEVAERPYRIDRDLTSLALAGKFDKCAGIVLGSFTNCREPDSQALPDTSIQVNGTFTISQIIDETLRPSNRPALGNLSAGHSFPQITLPFGAQIKIDAANMSLQLA